MAASIDFIVCLIPATSVMVCPKKEPFKIPLFFCQRLYGIFDSFAASSTCFTSYFSCNNPSN